MQQIAVVVIAVAVAAAKAEAFKAKSRIHSLVVLDCFPYPCQGITCLHHCIGEGRMLVGMDVFNAVTVGGALAPQQRR